MHESIQKFISNLRFANINFSYDKSKVSSEILNLPNLFDIGINHTALQHQHRIQNLFTEEQISNTTIYDSTKNLLVRKKYPAWSCASLTKIEGNNESLTGSFAIRNASQKINWVWKEDIFVPYIKEIVDRLHFKYLHTVRVLILPENSVGLVHNDDPHSIYGGTEAIGVTLNVDSGNSPLVFLEKTKRIDVYPGDTFIFRDDCWHGVPQVQKQRIQLRINGIPDFDFIYSLVDHNSVLWA